MTYVLIFLVVAIGLFIWFRAVSKKKLLNDLQRSVDMVKVGMYARLLAEYEARYESEFAGLLAAAVTNMAFSDEPSNEKGQHFLNENQALIETELRSLSHNQYLCHVLTQTIRARAVIPFAKGNHTAEALCDPLDKLRDFGILIPGGEFPELKTFYTLAMEFYQTRVKEKVA
jgi:hypothetical protein